MPLSSESHPILPDFQLEPCPTYYALWHLIHIGVISVDAAAAAPSFPLVGLMSDAWSKAKPDKPTLVAVMDNSVDIDHPNLQEAISLDLMIDFTSAPLGAFQKNSGPHDWNLLPELPETLRDEQIIGKLYGDLVQRLQSRSNNNPVTEAPQYAIEPANSMRFSAHGTSIAGLIGARPVTSSEIHSVTGQLAEGISDVELTSIGNAHPYAGVDPFCKMVPISMSFDDDPEQFIVGLLYAYIIGADVIVLPRDFPDHKKYEPFLTLDSDLAMTAQRDALDMLLIELSKSIPIVCAAGNERSADVIYPARLSAADNGIISVGPSIWDGTVSGFAPRNDPGNGSPIDIYAPSGDGKVLENEEVKLDLSDPFTFEQTFDPATQQSAIEPPKFLPQQIITTDVRGHAGYNNRPIGEPEDPDDFATNYTTFNGTSAASAITAGLISLKLTTGAWRGKSGPEIKASLINAAQSIVMSDRTLPRLHWD